MVIARFLFALIVCATVLTAQDVGLTSRAEKLNLRMGEPVRVTVTARVAVEIDSIGPLLVDSLGLFEVLSSSKEGTEREWTFALMTIDTGKVFLPPIAFGYVAKNDTALQIAYANSLLFHVSGIDVPADADIKDIKAPLNAPWTWEDIWPYLLVIGLLGAGWFVYNRYFRKEAAKGNVPAHLPPPTPPHIRALKELHQLEEKKLWQQGRTKEYYSECTEIVRRFFEGRFDLPALELTSDETLEHLLRQNIDQNHMIVTREFLERADIVKFAKGQPSPQEHERELELAYETVRSMAERDAKPIPSSEVASAG